jgi:cation diffusion facilitator CzcD-associated flavoprotein CzcO
MNHSPRVAQLDSTINYPVLDHDTQTDILIVGAGIAGCATTHFLLHDTDTSVVLFDG